MTYCKVVVINVDAACHDISNSNYGTLRFIYLLGFLRHFQHCAGHITTDSWNLVKVLNCKLQTSGKQLPAFPLEAVLGTEPQPQRWEVRVLPLCHRGPPMGH